MNHILCLHPLQVVWICLLVRIPPHTDRILQIEIPDSALRISRVPRRILSLHHLFGKLYRLTFCAIIEICPTDTHTRRTCMYKQYTSIHTSPQTHPDMPFHTAYPPVCSLPAPDNPSRVPHRHVPSSTLRSHIRSLRFGYEIHCTTTTRYSRSSPVHRDFDIWSCQNHMLLSVLRHIPPIALIRQV